MIRKTRERWNVPGSWKWANLSELGEIVSGGTPSTKEPSYWGDEINWISPADLTGFTAKTIRQGGKSLSKIGLANSSAKVMPAGSVHFSSRAPIGYVVISSQPLATNQGFKSLVPAAGIFNEYVYYYLMASRDYARRRASGTTFLELSGRAFGDLRIPVAPKTTQYRIVAKIEELLSELDKGVESLKTARAQLEVYRQAVLKHAFEGKLTTRWREENKDKLETAEELLARVNRERETCYEQQLNEWDVAVKAWKVTGKKRRKPTKPRIRAASPLPTDKDITGFPVLPNGWLWVKVQVLLTERPANGRSVKGRAFGFPVLRLTAIKNDKLDLMESKNGDWERKDALRYLVQKGDFLLARGNGSKRLVGRGGLVTDLERDIAYPDTMIRLRVNPSVIGEYFFSFVWNSRIVRRQIECAARTTAGIYKINQGHVTNFVLPLCSLSEQAVMVNRLSSALSAIDRIEMEVDNHLTKAHTLRQSILKKAFSGELVEQDLSDEPASVLLERINAEQASQKPKTKPRKRQVASA